MADGQSPKQKIGAIIQARMASHRLPNKILFPLPSPEGSTLLGRIIDLLKKSSRITHIIVATSKNPQDDVLVDFLQQQQVDFFRGDEQDVFSRFYQITNKHQFDIIARITGDNPSLDYQLLDQTIDYHTAQQNEYTKSTGLPMGMNFEIVSGNALTALNPSELSETEKEHVTPRFRNGNYKQGELQFDIQPEIANLRMTIDYPADYAMFSLLFAHSKPENTPLENLKNVFEQLPWIFNINAHLIQKKAFNTLEEELPEAISVLENLDLFKSAQELKALHKRNTQ